MFGAKKVKVCGKCSGFDVKELDALVGGKKYAVGCIGVCKMDRGRFYGKINGAVVACDTKEELFALIQRAAG